MYNALYALANGSSESIRWRFERCRFYLCRILCDGLFLAMTEALSKQTAALDHTALLHGTPTTVEQSPPVSQTI